jgi:endonuclease/exonuclease/phosphatase family metal-dependent hydrolase
MAAVRVVSWNLQGSTGLDVDAVVAVVGAERPDVFLAQEIQRRQCRRLATVGAFASSRWAFKHWPVVTGAEGLAVLSPHRLTASTAFVLRQWFPWSWKRRIAVEATVVIDGRPVRVVNVHLSPHDAHQQRLEEVARIRRRRGVVAPIVGGDLNDRPGGPAYDELRSSGWADAWTVAHPALAADAHRPGGELAPQPDPGATNWTAGERAGRPPTQRLDVVFVPDEWSVVDCRVIDEPLARLATLSDHLPLVVDLERA